MSWSGSRPSSMVKKKVQSISYLDEHEAQMNEDKKKFYVTRSVTEKWPVSRIGQFVYPPTLHPHSISLSFSHARDILSLSVNTVNATRKRKSERELDGDAYAQDDRFCVEGNTNSTRRKKILNKSCIPQLHFLTITIIIGK